MPKVTVAGNVESADFQHARLIVEDLKASGQSLVDFALVEMLEMDWLRHVEQHAAQLGGKVKKKEKGPLVTHSVIGYLGGLKELLQWALEQFQYIEERPSSFDYELLAEKRFNETLAEMKHPLCFLSLSVGAESKCGTLLFELYDDLCPKAVDNFLRLCGVATKSTMAEFKSLSLSTPPAVSAASSSSASKVTFVNSVIHRIVKDGWFQGGDLVDGTGAHSVSSWGPNFADESFTLKHDRPGILAMANTGPHSNGSQFYVTFRAFPSFDGKRVAFGRLLKGHATLTRLNELETVNQRPKERVYIQSCGKHELQV